MISQVQRKKVKKRTVAENPTNNRDARANQRSKIHQKNDLTTGVTKSRRDLKTKVKEKNVRSSRERPEQSNSASQSSLLVSSSLSSSLERQQKAVVKKTKTIPGKQKSTNQSISSRSKSNPALPSSTSSSFSSRRNRQQNLQPSIKQKVVKEKPTKQKIDSTKNDEKQKEKRKQSKPLEVLSYESSKESDVLFGSLPSDLFFKINTIVNDAIQEGVSSLPFLPTSSKTVEFSFKTLQDYLDDSDNKPTDQQNSSAHKSNAFDENDDDNNEGGDSKLLKLLRQAYLKNIDRAELYALRNIFTIQDLTKSKRLAVIHAYQTNISADELEKTLNESDEENRVENEKSGEKEKSREPQPSNNDNDKATGGNNEESTISLPKSKSEIPTVKDAEAVDRDIQKLRAKIINMRKMHKSISLKALKLEKLDRSIEKTYQSFESIIKETLETLQNQDGNKTDENNSSEGDKTSARTLFTEIRKLLSNVLQKKERFIELHERGISLNHRLVSEKRSKKGEGNGEEDDDDLSEFLSHAKKKRKTTLSLDEHFANMKKEMPASTVSRLGNMAKRLKKDR